MAVTPLSAMLSALGGGLQGYAQYKEHSQDLQAQKEARQLQIDFQRETLAVQSKYQDAMIELQKQGKLDAQTQAALQHSWDVENLGLQHKYRMEEMKIVGGGRGGSRRGGGSPTGSRKGNDVQSQFIKDLNEGITNIMKTPDFMALDDVGRVKMLAQYRQEKLMTYKQMYPGFDPDGNSGGGQPQPQVPTDILGTARTGYTPSPDPVVNRANMARATKTQAELDAENTRVAGMHQVSNRGHALAAAVDSGAMSEQDVQNMFDAGVNGGQYGIAPDEFLTYQRDLYRMQVGKQTQQYMNAHQR